MDRRRLLRIVICLIALYSIVLGILNWLFAVGWMKVMRMPMPDAAFWPRQSGAFLISMGLAYGLGALSLRYLQTSALVIVLSKSVAVVFLFLEYLFRDAPFAILLAGLGDLSILIIASAVAWWLYRHPDSKEADEQKLSR